MCLCQIKEGTGGEKHSSSFKCTIMTHDIIDCQVLLVTGTRGWIIPGGKVEPMEIDNPSVSAVREAREEGGVRGDEEEGGEHQSAIESQYNTCTSPASPPDHCDTWESPGSILLGLRLPPGDCHHT